MAGHYEQLWETAQKLFESESGKVIADIERKNLNKDKKKVSELKGVNTNAPKLKKPAEKFKYFGIRKSSGMEPACKKLDKAAGAKEKNEKDIQKAYDDYDKDRRTYQKILNTYAADETKPYHLVPKQIESLGKAMVKIGEEFINTNSKVRKEEWNKRIGLLNTQERVLSPVYKEMDAHLASLRNRNEDFPAEYEELGEKHYKSVAKEAEQIINSKLIPSLIALQKLASDIGIQNRFDFIIKDCKSKTDEHSFNSSDTVSRVRLWFTELEKDITHEIKELKKNS